MACLQIIQIAQAIFKGKSCPVLPSQATGLLRSCCPVAAPHGTSTGLWASSRPPARP